MLVTVAATNLLLKACLGWIREQPNYKILQGNACYQKKAKQGNSKSLGYYLPHNTSPPKCLQNIATSPVYKMIC